MLRLNAEFLDTLKHRNARFLAAGSPGRGGFRLNQPDLHLGRRRIDYEARNMSTNLA
jgi:hypothetical protein